MLSDNLITREVIDLVSSFDIAWRERERELDVFRQNARAGIM